MRRRLESVPSRRRMSPRNGHSLAAREQPAGVSLPARIARLIFLPVRTTATISSIGSTSRRDVPRVRRERFETVSPLRS